MTKAICTNVATHQIVCPICKKIKEISPAVFKRSRKTPWVCKRCSAKAKKLHFLDNAILCACGAWHLQKRKSERCQDCRFKKSKSIKSCVTCGDKFLGKAERVTCSPRCQYRVKMDKQYFGGNMTTAIGWDTKTCQACLKPRVVLYHVHHVFRHPDHSALVVLCAGCHKTVTDIAWRKHTDESIARIMAFGMMQRDGRAGGVIDTIIIEVKKLDE